MNGPARINAAGQIVQCRDCGKRYRCTPATDYYNSTTLDDGLCWDCLLAEHGEASDEPLPAPYGDPVKLRRP